MTHLLRTSAQAAVLLLAACNVDSQDATTTGVSLPSTPGDGAGALRGLVVIATDYQSTGVSLVSATGEVESPSFIGSASATTGLSAALSGDVVPPTSALPGDEIVLIDRLPASVLTWVELTQASVRAQLNVGTGFSSNPQDYVAITPTKAYVTRFDANPGPGREPFDAGDDVLVIDPSRPAISGRIDLAVALAGQEARFLARATRAVLAAGAARVLSSPSTADFGEFLPSLLLSIDTASDSVEHVLELAGLANCSALALAPDGGSLAVACSGAFGQDPALGFPDAGIALVELAGTPRVVRRFTAAELGGEQVGALTYATPTSLLFTSYGRYSADGSSLEAVDALWRLDLATAALDGEPLAETERTAFSFGDVRCAPAAGACLLADAESSGGVLRRFTLDRDGRVVGAGDLQPNPALGLPPRYLGVY